MGRLILPESPQNNQQPQNIYPQETGILGQLGQGALDLGAALVGAPGSLATGLFNLVATPEQREISRKAFGETGSPLPTMGSTVKAVRNLTGYTDPQTTSQKFAYNVGSAIPQTAAAFLTGGASSAATAAAAGAGSSAGRTAAQELGLGTAGEIALSLLGGGLGSNLARGGTKTALTNRGVVNKIIPLQKKSYLAEKELGKNLSTDGTTIKNALGGLEKEASDALSGPVYSKYFKQFLHDNNMISNSINKTGSIPLNKLTELKKQFNDIIYDKDTPVRAKTIYNKAKDLLLNELGALEQKYPEWGKEFRRGENLTTFIKGSERFKDFFKQHKELDGLLTELPAEIGNAIKKMGSPNTLPKALFKVGTAPVAVPLKYAAKEAGNTLELLSNPATRDLLSDLYKGIAQDNVGTVARSLLSLTGNENDQPSKPQPGTGKQSGRLILPTQS